MNVLILQGSPRANGNTAWMTENTGIFPAKFDEQKTDAAKSKIAKLVEAL